MNLKNKETAKINRLFNARKDIIQLFDDYTTVASKARYKAIKGKRTKILTSKQILQKLAVAVAQVKSVIHQNINQTKSDKLFIYFIEQEKSLRKHI